MFCLGSQPPWAVNGAFRLALVMATATAFALGVPIVAPLSGFAETAPLQLGPADRSTAARLGLLQTTGCRKAAGAWGWLLPHTGRQLRQRLRRALEYVRFWEWSPGTGVQAGSPHNVSPKTVS